MDNAPRRPRNLTTLTLYLGKPNADLKIIGEVRLPGFVEPAATFEIDPREFGLPRRLTDVREPNYSEPPYTLPPDVVSRLSTALLGHPGIAPVWLEFGSPSGTLPLIPWERVLSKALVVPIRRLPYLFARSVPNPGPIDFVVCASSPIQKAPFETSVVDQFIYTVLLVSPPGTTIHLFADADFYDVLKSQYASRPNVRLYSPDQAPRSRPLSERNISQAIGEPDDPDVEEIRDPWLRWIYGSMSELGADAVHFIGHGYLTPQHGMLALAESPTVNRTGGWAKFIGSAELNRFLGALGAWAVGFTAVPNNWSLYGLRLLADEIARLRVGSVLLHDAADSGSAAEAGTAYGRLFSRGTGIQSIDSTFSEDLQQRLTMYTDPRDLEEFADTDRFNLFPASQPTLQSTPSWLLATQRVLESTAGTLPNARQSSRLNGARAGAERALEFLKTTIQTEAAGLLQNIKKE